MFEGLRLIELHEEWAYAEFNARSEGMIGRPERSARLQARADGLDAEIRRRVAEQQPSRFWWSQVPLLHGTPDALREYPPRPRFWKGSRVHENREPDHWTHHARHKAPVASCHLCREGR